MTLSTLFKRTFLTTAITSSLACWVPASLAQEQTAKNETEKSASGELEKIVVTARKREETIQETPLSIQAFSTEQIEMRGIEDMSDLTNFTPGMNFNGGTSRANSDFSVRGMTQISATGDNRRDLVTIFMDGVPIIGTPAGMGTEDLARVEVIKGPQSAMFGRATFGGAISMITTTPSDTFTGHVGLTLGSYGEKQYEGSVEGPLIDGMLSGRLTFRKRDFDGFYDNALGGKLGATEQKYYSGTLNFTPAENFSLKVRYNKSDDFDGEAATQLVARYDEHNCGPFVEPSPRSMLGLRADLTLEQTAMRYCGEIKAPQGPISINLDNLQSTLDAVGREKHGMYMEKSLLSATAEWEFIDGYSATLILSDQDHDVETLFDFERTEIDAKGLIART